jgi:NADH-quinone oxidoreductase subunit G
VKPPIALAAYVAKAVPDNGGLNAAAMLKDPRQAYVVVGAEPELDAADGAQALAALAKAAVTVVLTPFKTPAMLEYAAVLLPTAPFTETSGTFVNTEGRVQSFYAAAKPLGDTRPGLESPARPGQFAGTRPASTTTVPKKCATRPWAAKSNSLPV